MLPGMAMAVCGRAGKRMMLRKKESPALKRVGTSSVMMMGMRKTSTLTRMRTSSQISICPVVKSWRAGTPSKGGMIGGWVTMGSRSAQQGRNHVQELVEKPLEELEHPRQEDQQGRPHGHQLGDEGQGHF